MTSFCNSIFILTFIFTLNACNQQSDSQNPKNTTSKSDTFLQKESIHSAFSKNKVGTYLHLEGTIKDIPIIMELSFKKPPKHFDWQLQNGFYEGFYYYEKYLEPIPVYQYQDSVGHTILAERYAFDEENQFIGKIDSMGNFSGIWKDGYRGTIFPFDLKNVANSEIVSFENYSFSDLKELPVSQKDKPSVTYDLHGLWPLNLEKTKGDFLETEFLKIMTEDDSLAATAQHLKEVFEQEKNEYFKNYVLDNEDLAGADSSEFLGAFYNWAYQLDMDVSWNLDELLCVAATYYEFTGGAHGNYGTTYYCYDLAQPKKLVEQDIFKRGFEETVIEALKKSAIRTFDSGQEDQSILDGLVLHEIEPNENFFITGGGIGYNFVPYEIGSYAIGEIRLFIPKEELMNVLTYEFKERMGW